MLPIGSEGSERSWLGKKKINPKKNGGRKGGEMLEIISASRLYNLCDSEITLGFPRHFFMESSLPAQDSISRVFFSPKCLSGGDAQAQSVQQMRSD